MIHLNIATCKWWFPFILAEKARFQMVATCIFKEPCKWKTVVACLLVSRRSTTLVPTQQVAQPGTIQ